MSDTLCAVVDCAVEWSGVTKKYILIIFFMSSDIIFKSLGVQPSASAFITGPGLQKSMTAN